MARVNIGVNPKYLSDQHLVAESVEITMITGQLRKHDYIIKSEIPTEFIMGKGHMNFFKNKLTYLKRRLDSVNIEMTNRGFNPGMILRIRIADRLITRANGKPANRLHRYNKRYIGWYNKSLGDKIIKSKLYCV